MYRAGRDANFCRNCGHTLFAHPISRRRYYNNPRTRTFLERLDEPMRWYEPLGYLLLLIWLPCLLIARCFGWRPNDDDE